MKREDEERLGRLLVQSKILTANEVEMCLRSERDARYTGGKVITIRDLLERKGLLMLPPVEKLLKEYFPPEPAAPGENEPGREQSLELGEAHKPSQQFSSAPLTADVIAHRKKPSVKITVWDVVRLAVLVALGAGGFTLYTVRAKLYADWLLGRLEKQASVAEVPGTVARADLVKAARLGRIHRDQTAERLLVLVSEKAKSEQQSDRMFLVESLYALGEMGANWAWHRLEVFLAAKDPMVRAAASWALGQIGAYSSAPKIRELLKDPEPQPFVEAAVALAKLGERSVLRELYALVVTQRIGAQHRIRALHALERTTGKIIMGLEAIDEWKQWIDENEPYLYWDLDSGLEGYYVVNVEAKAAEMAVEPITGKPVR